MNESAKQEIKSKLEEKSRQLTEELSRFAVKDKNVPDDWDTKFPQIEGANLEESANEVSQYATNLHVEFSLETQLRDVRRALERIDKGTYGACEACGKEIKEDRLLAAPETARCAACASS